jgi:hypothetical protein
MHTSDSRPVLSAYKSRNSDSAVPREPLVERETTAAPERRRRCPKQLDAGPLAADAQAYRSQLWLGINNRGPMTASGIYQVIARRGRECGIEVFPHWFRHHFSHTWLDRGGAEGDLMELNGWTSPQMLRRYGASARSAPSPPQLRPRYGGHALTFSLRGPPLQHPTKAKYPLFGARDSSSLITSQGTPTRSIRALTSSGSADVSESAPRARLLRSREPRRAA